MLRYPAIKSINIPTKEWLTAHGGYRGRPSRQADIGLFKIVNRLLHYFEFVPAKLASPLGVSVLSDYDDDLHSREFRHWDFIDKAQRVSEDDQWLFPKVFKRAETRLNQSINCEQNTREGRERWTPSLTFSDLSEGSASPGRSIDIFHVEVTLAAGPTAIRVESVEYEVLFENLLLTWLELPVGPPPFSPQTTLESGFHVSRADFNVGILANHWLINL